MVQSTPAAQSAPLHLQLFQRRSSTAIQRSGARGGMLIGPLCGGVLGALGGAVAASMAAVVGASRCR
jgi:hypothetical protein